MKVKKKGEGRTLEVEVLLKSQVKKLRGGGSLESAATLEVI